MNQKNQLKTVIIGDSGVGKTCVAYRATQHDFIPLTAPTVGSAHLSMEVQVDGRTVGFSIWDTAGQDEYRTLVPLYFQNTAVALVAFDITSHKSFDHVADWIELLQKKAPKNVYVVIVGNKLDMEASRQVQLEEAMHYASTIDALYMETSALTGQNVRELFMQIATAVVQAEVPSVQYETALSVDLTSPDTVTRRRGCC